MALQAMPPKPGDAKAAAKRVEEKKQKNLALNNMKRWEGGKRCSRLGAGNFSVAPKGIREARGGARGLMEAKGWFWARADWRWLLLAPPLAMLWGFGS